MRASRRTFLGPFAGASALVVAGAACASIAGLSGGTPGGDDAGKRPVDATIPSLDAARKPDAARVDAREATTREPDAGAPLDSPVNRAETDAEEASVDHDASSGGDAVGSVDAPADVNGCVSARPVGPPAAPSTGEKTVSFVAAVHEFTSGLTPTAGADAAIGFDLDGVCTCPGPPSCRSQSANCDTKPGGNDNLGNALGALFEEQMALSPPGDIDQRILAGDLTVLFQVSNYNGGANDTSVVVAVYSSSGTLGGATPAWDGSDVWQVDPNSASGLNPAPDGGPYKYTPLAFTSTAYVTDHVLVADLPTVSLAMGLGPLTLSGPVLVATIARDDAGHYSLDGQVAARISTYSLFSYASHTGFYDDAGQIQKLCGDNPRFVGLRSSVCAQADIMANPSSDNTDAGCNAVSVAIGFTSIQANFGPEKASHFPSAGCDGSVDDCTN